MRSLGAFDLSALPVPHQDGSWHTEKISRIAELLRDYDRNIEVRWIPQNNRSADEPAFAIVDTNPGGPEYVMFYVTSEAEFDETVIERVFQADAAKHGNILSKIEAKNLAYKAQQIQRQREELQEAHDLARSILRSPLHTFRHNGVKYE